jgi:acetyl-CoA carboxylase carboxyl transferase subunit beta
MKHELPYMIICQSGGARMQEAAYSLMQLAKVQSKLAQLSDKKLPYIAYLCDPTFGGITASFAMTADIIMAEPGALIGFAGPRVIRETIGKDLPEALPRCEFYRISETTAICHFVKISRIKREKCKENAQCN